MLFGRSISSILVAFALSALAAPANAADDEARQLGPGDFTSSVGKGMWLVEFFSPHCPHCVRFAPTWKKLEKEHKNLETESNFHMAQVNCIAHGDLCAQQKVEYYPMIKLYQDGVSKEVYSEDRGFDPLSKYIKTKAADYSGTSSGGPAAVHDESPLSSSTANPDGKVLALTGTTFKAAQDEGPLFVKFYAPWCGHCKKLAPTWAELAKNMARKANIAEVNCDDNSALCGEHGIQGFPTLVFFNGGHKAEYRGSRNLEALEQFIGKAVAPGLQSVKNSEIDALAKDEKVFYLFLHSLGTAQHDINKVEEAAKPLLGTPSVVKSTDPEAWGRFKQDLNLEPVLLAIKDGESAGRLMLDRTVSVRSIYQWLSVNRYATADELTSDNFQAVMRSDINAYVVLVPLNTEKLKGEALEKEVDALKTTSKLWRINNETVKSRPVVFVWMDGVRWAKWLKSMYGVKLEEMPAIIIADHQNLVYYDRDSKGTPIVFEAPAIVNALRDISKGSLKYKYSENIVERTMRGLHNRMEGMGRFFTNHPLQAVFWVVMFVSFIIYVMYKAIQADTKQHHRPPRLD